MVLAILVDTTEPTFSFLIPACVPLSLPSAAYPLLDFRGILILRRLRRSRRLHFYADSLLFWPSAPRRLSASATAAPFSALALAPPASAATSLAPASATAGGRFQSRARAAPSASAPAPCAAPATSSALPSAPSTSGTAAGTSAPPHSRNLLGELGRVERPCFFRVLFHAAYSTRSRVTNLVGNRSFAAASLIASSATSFATPSISNRILPGRITHTH